MSDPYKGQGGAYVLDAKTGKRKLIERTGEAVREVATEPSAEVAQPVQEETDSQE